MGEASCMRVAGLMAAVVAFIAPAAEPAARPGKVHITVSKGTTYVLGPRNPDGTIDYVAAANALLSKGVTRENNAAIPLLRVLGPNALDEKMRDRTLKALGLDALPADGDYFLSKDEYVEKAYPDDDQQQLDALERMGASTDKAGRGPISPQDHREVAEWVRWNAGALQRVTAAAKLPRHFVPWVSACDPPEMLDGLVPLRHGSLHEVWLALQARAMLRAHSGELDRALGDLQTVRRLARLSAQRGLLLDVLIGAATNRSALESMQGLATSDRLDAEQACRLIAAVDTLPPLADPYPACMAVEHLFALDCVMRFARHGLDGATRFYSVSFGKKEDPLPPVDLDIDLMLRLTNEDWQAVVAAGTKRSYAEREKARAALDKISDPDVAAILEQHAGSFDYRKRLRALIARVGAGNRERLTRAVYELPPIGGKSSHKAFGEMFESAAFRRELVKLAAALRRYRCRTGQFPNRLAALVPADIPSIPKDRFSGEPLIYRRTAKGYLLYSVGPNKADDGGIEKYHAKDLVVEAE